MNAYIANTLKALRLIATNQSMGPALSFYDPKFPPWKYLIPQRKWIHVNCIMSGFPRTGTHWIRNVIEKSCNLKTGDLFEKKPGYEDKYVALIKIHARSKRIAMAKAIWLLPPFKFDHHFIYVYRDPRDAIISLFEMYKKRKNMDHLTPSIFLEKYDPIRQYQWEINEWVIRRPANVYQVKFENLKKTPGPNLNVYSDT
ncbi:MAG: sulfotransferase domain-containing protein [Candidatus Hodarchaeota archaeon]